LDPPLSSLPPSLLSLPRQAPALFSFFPLLPKNRSRNVFIFLSFFLFRRRSSLSLKILYKFFLYIQKITPPSRASPYRNIFFFPPCVLSFFSPSSTSRSPHRRLKAEICLSHGSAYFFLLDCADDRNIFLLLRQEITTLRSFPPLNHNKWLWCFFSLAGCFSPFFCAK